GRGRVLLQQGPADPAALPAVPHRLPGRPLHHPRHPAAGAADPAVQGDRTAVPLADPFAHLPLVQASARDRPSAVPGQAQGPAEGDRPPDRPGPGTGAHRGAAVLLRVAVRPARARALHDLAPGAPARQAGCRKGRADPHACVGACLCPGRAAARMAYTSALRSTAPRAPCRFVTAASISATTNPTARRPCCMPATPSCRSTRPWKTS